MVSLADLSRGSVEVSVPVLPAFLPVLGRLADD